MSLSSVTFIMRFLPLFLLLYYLVNPKLRRIVLAGGSIVFYAMGNWKQCLLLLGLTIINYLLAFALYKNKKAKTRKILLILLILMNVGVLVFFKYFTSTLPMGISFYTFMNLSCFIDVYRKQAKMINFMCYVNYVFMFPKILQGPIVRYQDFRPQLLQKHKYKLANIESGLQTFIVGLAFKTIFADQIFTLWNSIHMIGYRSISTPMAWLGAAAYSMELYFDFQGYSLMAIGTARMLGYEFPENFLHPYRSKTVGEFYRRWHATLGSWFKNYIYIPLGGNRRGNLITIRNLIIVWALTGIWHGTSLNFLIWGFFLVLLIILEKYLYGNLLNKIPALGILYIWIVIPFSWVIFALPDFKELATYLARMFPFFGVGQVVNSMDFMIYGKPYFPLMGAAFLVSLPIADKLWEKYRNTIWVKIILFLVFWFCVYEISISSQNPFMYGGF